MASKKGRALMIDAALSDLQTAALLLPAKGPWREADKRLPGRAAGPDQGAAMEIHVARMDPYG
jgi:hypothetical protein